MSIWMNMREYKCLEKNAIYMLFPNYNEEIRSILPYYDSFHQETINFVKSMNSKPAIWLDTGCGTGTFVERALKHFPNAKFVLADPSAEMLEEARKKLFGSDRITFLKPNSINDLLTEIIGRPDVITAILSHHYLSEEDRIKVTQVCYDLLNQGGIYVTFENIRPMTERGVEIGKRNWKSF